MLRLCVIGVGRAGLVHAANIHGLIKHAELVALCDSNAEGLAGAARELAVAALPRLPRSVARSRSRGRRHRHAGLPAPRDRVRGRWSGQAYLPGEAHGSLRGRLQGDQRGRGGGRSYPADRLHAALRCRVPRSKGTARLRGNGPRDDHQVHRTAARVCRRSGSTTSPRAAACWRRSTATTSTRCVG